MFKRISNKIFAKNKLYFFLLLRGSRGEQGESFSPWSRFESIHIRKSLPGRFLCVPIRLPNFSNLDEKKLKSYPVCATNFVVSNPCEEEKTVSPFDPSPNLSQFPAMNPCPGIPESSNNQFKSCL